MNVILLQSIYFFLMSFALAVLEIQIEGPNGWAAKIPTWRPGNAHWLGRLFKKVNKGEELTGYHLVLIIFLLLMFHWPYLWFAKWSLANELLLMGFFVFFTVVWDFLWFILNPHHSLKKFGPLQATWHKVWIGRLPIKYAVGAIAAAALFCLASFVSGISLLIGLENFLILAAVNVFFTLLTIIFYPKTF
ncbi:MAG: hypothetical protein PHE59_01720 [Patescibacteria group bacterium]|nr:hypothetical protein [Patescibacteria group bacterium]MDD5164904.1 hypothetical protein [Patescibacteria group bacterium]MDD5534709.1 hypothetical protein [Patescibacteria group bacterium]